jgi:hypothetical protein
MAQTAPDLAAPRQDVSLRDWLPATLGAVAIAVLFGALTLGRAFVDVFVEEDGPVEWIGAIGLFAGAGLFFAAFLTARRRGAGAVGLSRLGVWVLLLLALALFVAGGEEISWGQRLFGWGTPDSIAAVNAQDETTLHNLTEFQSGILDGDRLFKLAWMGLFVLVPLVAAGWPRARAWLSRLVPVVPLRLAALFVLTWVLATVATHALVGHYSSIYPLSHAVSEVEEAVVETLAGIGALITFVRVRRGRANTPSVVAREAEE